MKIENLIKKSIKSLDRIAWNYFSKFIRDRDSEDGYFTCISCGKTKSVAGGNCQAGHYYPAGKFKSLKYDEHNVNAECEYCNYYSGDHLIGYRGNLIVKIGIQAFEKLEVKAEYNKRHGSKIDRLYLIDVIERFLKKPNTNKL